LCPESKVSGYFRNPEYAQACCRISSYLQTMANGGYNPHIAIQLALSGQFDSLPGGVTPIASKRIGVEI
jgi:transposase